MGVIQKGRGGGGAEVFTSDFVVTLTPPKTFGKYENGETVPANGKTAKQLLLDIAQEYITPAFNPPTLIPNIVQTDILYNPTVNYTLNFASNSFEVQLIDTNTNTILAVAYPIVPDVNNQFISSFSVIDVDPTHVLILRSINVAPGTITDSATFLPNINTYVYYGISDTLPLIANAQALIDDAENNYKIKHITTSDTNLAINFNTAVGKYLWFAEPIANVNRTRWFVDNLNQGDIGTISDLFGAKQIATVNDPTNYFEPISLWSNKDYYFYFSNSPTTNGVDTPQMQLRNFI